MFSKTLVKLIDSAIFPAVFIIASKILAIAFLSRTYDTSYQVEGMKLVYSNAQDFIMVNSYSSLFMFLAVLSGLIWIVFKAHVLHSTHVKPSISARLLEMNMHHMVNRSSVVFTESFVWLSYAWLTTLIIGGYSFFELGYWWVFYFALGVSVVATALMAIDFEREVKAGFKPVVKVENDSDVEISLGNRKLIKITDLSKELN